MRRLGDAAAPFLRDRVELRSDVSGVRGIRVPQSSGRRLMRERAGGYRDNRHLITQTPAGCRNKRRLNTQTQDGYHDSRHLNTQTPTGCRNERHREQTGCHAGTRHVMPARPERAAASCYHRAMRAASLLLSCRDESSF